MSIFQDVNISFDGEDYKIEAKNVMRLIAQIEDIVMLGDLTRPGSAPVAKISQAYGLALRFAGASVTDEEVYQSVFTKAGKGVMTEAVSGLLAMMVPPQKLQDSISANAPAGTKTSKSAGKKQKSSRKS